VKPWGDPGRLLEQSTGGVAGEPHLALTKHLIMREHTMESQGFLPAECSLRPVDLLPPDDLEDDAADIQWLEYCRMASTLDRTRILEVVLSDLDADDSPLYEFIDDAIANPHEPGRPKANITDLARLGQSLLNRIAKAVDDQTASKFPLRWWIIHSTLSRRDQLNEPSGPYSSRMRLSM
jgi:hypothetical protein